MWRGSRPQELIALLSAIFWWSCAVMEQLTTKKVVVSLCAREDHDRDRKSVKTKRSKVDLSDLGLNTFKQTQERLMGKMKTKIEA